MRPSHYEAAHPSPSHCAASFISGSLDFLEASERSAEMHTLAQADPRCPDPKANIPVEEQSRLTELCFAAHGYDVAYREMTAAYNRTRQALKIIFAMEAYTKPGIAAKLDVLRECK